MNARRHLVNCFGFKYSQAKHECKSRRRFDGRTFEDNVAIVTGAGSSGPGWGNGKATAVLFAREGARVFAIDINPDAVAETAQVIANEGGACTVYQADVSRTDEVQKLVENCLETYGRIDVLLNNVGILEWADRLKRAKRTGTASWR
jgi:NAD(P)-dependent dehydrogenase (short-subunit alcohol dehydrogenase family)